MYPAIKMAGGITTVMLVQCVVSLLGLWISYWFISEDEHTSVVAEPSETPLLSDNQLQNLETHHMASS